MVELDLADVRIERHGDTLVGFRKVDGDAIVVAVIALDHHAFSWDRYLTSIVDLALQIRAHSAMLAKVGSN